MNESAITVAQSNGRIDQRYLDAIQAALADSRRESTRRSYAGAWRRFCAWAEAEGLQTLPADPITVAAYMTNRADQGLSGSSLSLDRKAISYHHRIAGWQTPTLSDDVKLTVAGLRNRAAAEGRGDPRQARGLTERDLGRIVATAHERRRGPTGRRESVEAARRRGDLDIALVSVMRDALLRRGETTELRWHDIDFRRDGSSRITIRRSKTSVTSAVQYVGFRATAALRRIAPPDPDPNARVFGLRCGRSIANRIASMARAAGLGEGFSGHSPRVGMAQDLTAAGTGLTALMVAGRWKSERMPAHYARAQAARRGAVAQFHQEASRG